jgi:proline iminopeptidase
MRLIHSSQHRFFAKRSVKIFLSVCAIILVTLAWLIFVPRSYDVKHLAERKGTQYWELRTGSKIGYTFLEGRGKKYPFPLIYLHGGPGAGITDREVNTYQQLADKGFDVYLYDQVGCGHSGRLEDINGYTAERHERDLEAIIEKIGASKVVLIGQSWGSILGTMYVADHPSKIERFIVTAPAPLQPAKKEMENIMAPDSLGLRKPYLSPRLQQEKNGSLRSRMMYALARRGIKLVGDREADEFATYLINELNKSMVCDTANAVVAEGTEGLYVQLMTSKSLRNVKDRREAIKRLYVPVLIMKAQCDNQPWGYAAEYLQTFPECEFLFVKNAGHNIFLERPDEYVKGIEQFLLKKNTLF